MSYYISKIVKASFSDTEQKVVEALKNEGFGVLTEIDIQKKLKEKINVDFRKYKILGVCNPPFAYMALQKEDKVGVMLPCNVIIQELEEDNIEVAAVDPAASMMAIENSSLVDIAGKIKERLERVIESI